MRTEKMAIFGVITLVTILLIYILNAFEYLSGDGDGLLAGQNIRQIGLKFLLVETILFLIYAGFKSKNNFVIQSLLIIISSIVTLLLAEFLVGWISKIQANAAKSAPKTAQETNYKVQYKGAFTESDTLGFKATPNWYFQWPRQGGGKALEITSDNFSRRVTPAGDSALNVGIPNQYALFFGCSFTYGDGVSDEETMPAHFQKIAPNYKAYNYGFLGYSPLHTLARLQSENVLSQIPQKNGFAVFTYIQDHIDRTIPATRWVLLQQGRFPNLEHSSMKIEGLYKNKHRIWVDLLNRMASTNIWNYFRLGYPKYHSDAHYQLVVDVIAQSKKEYQHQFKNDKFYVIIFPGQKISPSMKQMFEKAGLVIYDYSNLLDIKKYILEADPAHPNAEAYRKVMVQFYADLKKKGIV